MTPGDFFDRASVARLPAEHWQYASLVQSAIVDLLSRVEQLEREIRYLHSMGGPTLELRGRRRSTDVDD